MASAVKRSRDDHSSATPVARRLQQPTRTAWSGHRSRRLLAAGAESDRRAVPIRSCSRWGLPCRLRYRRRGALLPHRFTLAGPCGPPPRAEKGRDRRSLLCGTFPGLAPAGCYPAPYVHGARTFLSGLPFGLGPSSRPADWHLWQWGVDRPTSRPGL